MRILIVTSQFPIAGEPHRGRPVYQTVRELSRLADVKVLSPIATYPGWARPRSYLYRPAEQDAVAPGCDADYVTYPALPALSRPFNGHLCARALSRPVRAFAPDVVLAYWLYPDGYGALRAAREAGVFRGTARGMSAWTSGAARTVMADRPAGFAFAGGDSGACPPRAPASTVAPPNGRWSGAPRAGSGRHGR